MPCSIISSSFVVSHANEADNFLAHTWWINYSYGISSTCYCCDFTTEFFRPSCSSVPPPVFLSSCVSLQLHLLPTLSRCRAQKALPRDPSARCLHYRLFVLKALFVAQRRSHGLCAQSHSTELESFPIAQGALRIADADVGLLAPHSLSVR